MKNTAFLDIDSGKRLPPEIEEELAKFREQLLIVFVKRLGGKLTIPVSEADDTGNDIMIMESDAKNRTFTFEVRRKDG